MRDQTPRKKGGRQGTLLLIDNRDADKCRAAHSKRGTPTHSVHSRPACLVFHKFGAHLGSRNCHAQASFCEDRHLENLDWCGKLPHLLCMFLI
jgi:hypothetical protein